MNKHWLLEPIGKKLAQRFRLKSIVSESPNSSVARCEDRQLNRDVAIKVIACPEEDSQRRKAVQELNISLALRHPALATPFDGRQTSQHIVLVSPWIEGGTLADRLIKAGSPADPSGDRLGTLAAIKVLIPVAEAVHYLHGKGYLHGDIKPENILCDPQGAYLTDFGSCFPIEDPPERGALVGTAAYLAPEVALGTSAASVASDVYALGATLFAAIAGQAPFSGEDHHVLQSLRSFAFPAIRELEPRTPRAFDAIIRKACDPEPSRRYRSAKDFADDLKNFLAKRSLHAQPASRLREGYLWGRRNPLRAGLLIGLLFVLTGGSLTSVAGWRRAFLNRRELREKQVALRETGNALKCDKTKLTATLEELAQQQGELNSEFERQAKLTNKAEQARQNSIQQKATAVRLEVEAKQKKRSILSIKQENEKLDRQAQENKRRANAFEELEGLKRQRLEFNRQYQESLKKIFRGEKQDLAWLNAGAHGPRELDFLSETLRSLNHRTRGHGGGATTEFETIQRFEFRIRSAAVSAFRFSPTSKDKIEVFSERESCWVVDPATGAVKTITGTVGRLMQMFQAGEISSLFVYATDSLLLRQNPRHGDLELLRISNGNFHDSSVLLSCRKLRSAHSREPSRSEATKLTPFFLSVGSNPAEHLCFLSADRSDPDGPAHTFIHSVDLRDFTSTGAIRHSTYDLGWQDLATWPSQLQLSEHLLLGVRADSLLSTDFQHGVHKKRLRFPVGRPEIGYPDRGWKYLAAADRKQRVWPEQLLRGFREVVPEARSLGVMFLPVPGHLAFYRHWQSSDGKPKGVYSLDAMTGETLLLSDIGGSFLGSRSATLPQRDRFLRRSGSQEMAIFWLHPPTDHALTDVSVFNDRYLRRLAERVFQPPEATAIPISEARP